MKEKNKEDITPVFALLAVSVILAILTIFSFVMMQRATNKKIAAEKAYYQIQAEAMFFEEISEVFEYLLEEEKSINAELKEDNKDLKKQIDLLQNAIVEKNVDYAEFEPLFKAIESVLDALDDERHQIGLLMWLANEEPLIMSEFIKWGATK